MENLPGLTIPILGFNDKKEIVEKGKLVSPVAIQQGGMAVGISMAGLAAAVSGKGGIGLIAASGLTPDELISEIRKARKLSKGVIGINVMVAVKLFPELVKAAIKENIDLVVAGAGFSRDAFKWCLEAGIPYVPIIKDEKGASLCVRLGASAVVLECEEAGGHLATLESTWDVLPRVTEKVSVPVIAAGGILTRADINRALSLGASGVQMGMRFALSEESSAAESWKQECVDACSEDVVYVASPTGMYGRALNNDFVQQMGIALENLTSQNSSRIVAERLEDLRPRRLRKVQGARCVECLAHCERVYCIMHALRCALVGDLKNALIFCDKRVGEINDILSVEQIFAELLA